MKKYQKYKNTNIEWIGEIPERWDVISLGLISKIGSGTTPSSGNPKYYLEGDVNWLNTGDLKGRVINNTSRKITKEALIDYSTLKIYKKGCVAMAMYGATIGAISILGIDTTVNQACAIMEPLNKLDTKYLYYFLIANKTKLITDAIGGGQPNVSQDIIKKQRITVPSCEEQSKIVSYLDFKTFFLDNLIEKNEKLIKLIEEKKTISITQIITKGINQNVTLKNSGIEWIGDIPEHWKVSRIRRLSSVKRGASPRPIADPKYFNENGEYAWVRIADVSKSEKYLEKTTQKLSDLGSSLSVKMKPGDLFLSIAGTVGKPIISKIKCCIHDGFVYFPDLKINDDYLFYILASGRPYVGLGKMGTQLNLNTDTVADISIPIPPDNEILAIVNHLDKTTFQFNSTIQKYKLKAKLLKEYRKTLISNVVTGKIDVRDEKIPESGIKYNYA